MKQLAICPDCSGYVPESAPCPHCQVAAPEMTPAMRLLKRSLMFVACGAAAVTLSACYGMTPGQMHQVEKVDVTGVNAVVVGSNVQLTATATRYNTDSYDATSSAVWTTNSAGIATVSPGGLVTGVAPGSVVIRATEQGVYGTANVMVSASASAFAEPVAGLQP